MSKVKIAGFMTVLVLVAFIYPGWLKLPSDDKKTDQMEDYSNDPLVLSFAKPGEFALHILSKAVGEPFVPDASSPGLYVTGTYTGTDEKPTGLFVAEGKTINSHPLGWDGILIVDGKGNPSFGSRRSVKMGGKTYDLTDKETLADFLKLAKEEKLSVLQSHMLVTDGKVDVRERAEAKKFRRRMLINTSSGNWLVLDTTKLEDGPKITLFEAANLAHDSYNARYTLNLDMGSYDYCRKVEADESVTDCGLTSNTAQLSNILQMLPNPANELIDAEQ